MWLYVTKKNHGNHCKMPPATGWLRSAPFCPKLLPDRLGVPKLFTAMGAWRVFETGRPKPPNPPPNPAPNPALGAPNPPGFGVPPKLEAGPPTPGPPGPPPRRSSNLTLPRPRPLPPSNSRCKTQLQVNHCFSSICLRHLQDSTETAETHEKWSVLNQPCQPCLHGCFTCAYAGRGRCCLQSLLRLFHIAFLSNKSSCGWGFSTGEMLQICLLRVEGLQIFQILTGILLHHRPQQQVSQKVSGCFHLPKNNTALTSRPISIRLVLSPAMSLPRRWSSRKRVSKRCAQAG